MSNPRQKATRHSSTTPAQAAARPSSPMVDRVGRQHRATTALMLHLGFKVEPNSKAEPAPLPLPSAPKTLTRAMSAGPSVPAHLRPRSRDFPSARASTLSLDLSSPVGYGPLETHWDCNPAHPESHDEHASNFDVGDEVSDVSSAVSISTPVGRTKKRSLRPFGFRKRTRKSTPTPGGSHRRSGATRTVAGEISEDDLFWHSDICCAACKEIGARCAYLAVDVCLGRPKDQTCQAYNGGSAIPPGLKLPSCQTCRSKRTKCTVSGDTRWVLLCSAKDHVLEQAVQCKEGANPVLLAGPAHWDAVRPTQITKWGCNGAAWTISIRQRSEELPSGTWCLVPWWEQIYSALRAYQPADELPSPSSVEVGRSGEDVLGGVNDVRDWDELGILSDGRSPGGSEAGDLVGEARQEMVLTPLPEDTYVPPLSAEPLSPSISNVDGHHNMDDYGEEQGVLLQRFRAGSEPESGSGGTCEDSTKGGPGLLPHSIPLATYEAGPATSEDGICLGRAKSPTITSQAVLPLQRISTSRRPRVFTPMWSYDYFGCEAFNFDYTLDEDLEKVPGSTDEPSNA